MWKTGFKRGDWVIFRKPKWSTCPGPRATSIDAAPHGELYAYVVDKFWVVEDQNDTTVVVRTRRGKRHELQLDDPHLRRLRWWECVLYRHRFPELTGIGE